MRGGRSTPSSCGVGEEYSEYRGWRERQTYRSSRTSNRNGHWSQGWQRLHMNGARKTNAKMAGHTQGVCERSHHQRHETRRQREREWDGEELPRLSPGVGCDSTAQPPPWPSG